MKKRRKITRAKKAKISEILTDSSRASQQLHQETVASSEAKAKKQLQEDLAKLQTRFSGIKPQPVEEAADIFEGIVQALKQPLVVLDHELRTITNNRAFAYTFGIQEGKGSNEFLERIFNLISNGRSVRDCFLRALSSRLPIDDIKVEFATGTGESGTKGTSLRFLQISARPFFAQSRNTVVLLVSIEDITWQRQVNEALRREQIMLARAEALAHVGGWEWNIAENEVIWSEELYRVFGIDKKAFTPTYQGYLQLIHPEDRAAVESLVREGIKNGKPLDFYHRVIRADGERILHCQAYFIFNKQNRPVTLLGIAQDVTELRKTEDELRTAYRELEERSRSLQRSNEEMQAFSYSIAHDLRAPLRAIQGMSRILMEDYGHVLDADGQDYFKRIMDAAQRMDDLIRDLLDYARMTTVQLPIGAVDAEAIWARVIANFSTEIQEKNALIDKSMPFPTVFAHRTVVELALNNLLGNALKFFPKGGRPEIRIWTDRIGDSFIRFNIQDKGIGIAAEHQQRIFRVFERLHPADAFPGTGIGLAIVKKGIERVGGNVGLTSVPGEGSTFWFELPSEPGV